ncbi:hypothetical protein DPX16_0307 [Anabarilius grahami]|uniref:AIG1-type G domain-containing protein n=1 Tax=Anabarilius grahami TaxID=495550 RepID=A0A3N0XYA2_ANAGA|nr:hypothetical protein DPX16_0307 [Anabarilius grahami]
MIAATVLPQHKQGPESPGTDADTSSLGKSAGTRTIQMDDAMESETEEKNSKDNVNRADGSVLDKGTCDPVKKEVNEETIHMQSTLVHVTSEDQTEDNEDSGEKGSSSKPDDHVDVSEAPAPCDSDSSLSSSKPNLSVVLFGNSSAIQFGNTNILLGEKQTAEIPSIVPLQRKISEHQVSVINITGLHETDHVDLLIDHLVNENEIHAFIFVVQLSQLTEADKMRLEWLQRVFGDKVLRFVTILCTYEKKEHHETTKEDLKKNPVLKWMMEKCGGRFQTCNMMMDNQSELRDLMNKIELLFNMNQQLCYTVERRETEEPQCSESDDGTPINKGKEPVKTTEKEGQHLVRVESCAHFCCLLLDIAFSS